MQGSVTNYLSCSRFRQRRKANGIRERAVTKAMTTPQISSVRGILKSWGFCAGTFAAVITGEGYIFDSVQVFRRYGTKVGSSKRAKGLGKVASKWN